MINIPLTSTFKNTGFKQAEKSISGLERSTKRLGIALASAFSVRKLGYFTKSSIMAASRLEESMSKVSVVFGSTSLQVEAFGRSSAASLGISSAAALEAAGTYGNLLQAFGIGQRQAQDMSLALVQLAADMASFNNTSIDQAITALRSGLSGETEPLKRFGVALTDARLRTEALSLGLVKNTKEALGPAVKAQAAYALIMKDTTLAQGDFARTSSGVANSLKILSAAAENATAIVGEGLIKSMDLLADRKNGVEQLANAFENVATNVSNAIVGFSGLISLLKSADRFLRPEYQGGFKLTKIVTSRPEVQALLALMKYGEKLQRADRIAELGPGNRQSPRVAEMEQALALKAWRKQQRAAEKLRKEQERIAKAAKAARQEEERKAKILEKLSKAEKIFDDERISVAAALQNKSLDENEQLRLQLKKAILNENADKALELADRLEESQKKLGKLKELSDTFKPANPFQPWLDAIDELNRRIAAMGNVTAPTMAQGDAAAAMISLGQSTGNQQLFDEGLNMLNNWLNQGNDAATLAGLYAEQDEISANIRGKEVEQQVINLNMTINNLEGNLPDSTKAAIVDTVVEAASRGYGTGWFRTTDTYAV